jgi:hypothetical protein
MLTSTLMEERRVLVTALATACLCLSAASSSSAAYRHPGELLDATSSGAEMGRSVALSEDGSVAVVGEPGYEGGRGAALVYSDSRGDWTLEARLTPAGEQGAGRFGAAVAIDNGGRSLMVGAPQDDSGVGAAWAFALSEGSWIEQGRLTGGAAETGAGQFGAAVAISNGGTLALVGAPLSGAGEGQAFTYHYEEAEGWVPYQHMNMLGVGAEARFGASLSLSNNGNVALVGAPGAGAGAGAVYPFSFFGLDSPYWIDGNEIESPVANAEFGASVAVAFGGSVGVVGAPGAEEDRGAAYEYTRSGLQEDAFVDPAAQPGARFGAAVSFPSLATDHVLVGAPGQTSGTGAAYEFDTADGPDWFAEGTAISASSDSAAGNSYGAALAVSADGTVALLGAPGTGGGDGSVEHLTSLEPLPPGPPRAVTAVAGVDSAAVSWQPPESDGGAPISRYRVSASPGGQGCEATTATACEVVGLAGGSTYTFTVAAANSTGWGESSTPSSAVTTDPPPGHESSREGTSPASAGPGGAGTLVSPLAAGAAPGSSAGPARPSGRIVLRGRTRTSITLTWGASRGSDPVLAYRLYELQGRRWRLLGSTPAAKRSFTVLHLARLRRVRMAVRALDRNGRVSPPLVSTWLTT